MLGTNVCSDVLVPEFVSFEGEMSGKVFEQGSGWVKGC